MRIMQEGNHAPILASDPVLGKPLWITELQTEDGDVTIRHRWPMPKMLGLSEEEAHFLTTFLRCRGVISSVEKELGISYPTVSKRLDALLNSLGLKPIERVERQAPSSTARLKVIEELERGDITAEEAKAKLKEAR